LVEGKIRTEMLSRLNSNIVGNLLEEQRVQLLAQPVAQSARLNRLVEGVDDWEGRIIDPERIREQRLRATVKDVLFWRDYLVETKPAMVVVGDIEEK